LAATGTAQGTRKDVIAHAVGIDTLLLLLLLT
jgi:hypothetical protein